VSSPSVLLAVHTHSLRAYTPAAAVEAAVAAGVDAVELWLPHADDDLLAALADAGLAVAAVGGVGVYERGDLPQVERAAALAEASGASLVVGCAAPPLLDAVLDRLPERLRLALENHWDQPLATAREVRAALEPRPRLGACLDTGHAILAGERPDRAVAALGERLAHVHLKDARPPRRRELVLGRRLRRRLFGRPEPAPPGAGSLDLDAVAAALAAAGYRGTVTLEFEGEDAGEALARLSRLAAAALGRAARSPA
jgi:inosose dehydratase